ncbi:hypothetical protein K3165_06465 [Qipengyuania sp. 1XM1-15A]|uniref:hypothetical protein n=1 Tax=Qipengyuania xiamenensis TaxID=2867237 RepID=UPI001C875C8A|nr:hypothetical protein [Qipengyuania xiamenensis]MBX7532559.1 hypothetical protein [Qipengyuania xiamenensis]
MALVPAGRGLTPIVAVYIRVGADVALKFALHFVANKFRSGFKITFKILRIAWAETLRVHFDHQLIANDFAFSLGFFCVLSDRRIA